MHGRQGMKRKGVEVGGGRGGKVGRRGGEKEGKREGGRAREGGEGRRAGGRARREGGQERGGRCSRARVPRQSIKAAEPPRPTATLTSPHYIPTNYRTTALRWGGLSPARGGPAAPEAALEPRLRHAPSLLQSAPYIRRHRVYLTILPYATTPR